MKSLFLPLSVLLILTSCAGLGGGNSNQNVTKHTKTKYLLKDKSGEFLLEREKGINKKKNYFVVKAQVLPKSGDLKKVLERSITISNPGVFKKKLSILRPLKSEYNVWFDGKKYTSKMSVNVENKSMMVRLISPEKQWNKKMEVPFPSGNGVFCYYSQIIECARFTGFIGKALEEGTGKMNFTLIWDGYPYIQEQYLNLPNSVFSNAKLSFDGTNRKGDKRFTLSVGNQNIFYLLNKENELKKVFWISQGLSIVESEM